MKIYRIMFTLAGPQAVFAYLAQVWFSYYINFSNRFFFLSSFMRPKTTPMKAASLFYILSFYITR